MKRFNSRLRWFAAVVVVAGALVALKFGRSPSVSSAAPAAGRFEQQRPVITRLVGRNHTVTISASGNGPVYSVADAQGKTLLSGASAEELRRAHPEIYQQLNSTIASGEGGGDGRVLDASISRD